MSQLEIAAYGYEHKRICYDCGKAKNTDEIPRYLGRCLECQSKGKYPWELTRWDKLKGKIEETVDFSLSRS